MKKLLIFCAALVVLLAAIIYFRAYANNDKVEKKSANITVYNGGQIELTFDNGGFMRLENDFKYIIEVSQTNLNTIMIVKIWLPKRAVTNPTKEEIVLNMREEKEKTMYTKLLATLEKNGSLINIKTYRDTSDETATYLY